MRPVACLVVLSALCASASAQQVVEVPAANDNTLYFHAMGDVSNGAGERFFSGVNGIGQPQRGLVRFDLTTAVPPGATVTAVDLVLEMVMTLGGPLQIELHRVLASWGEGASDGVMGEGGGAAAQPGDATWLHRFYPDVFWANTGGDFDGAASAVATVSQMGTVTWTSTPQLVADVQAWLNNPANNHGWLLLSPEQATGNGKAFASRENPVQSLHPKLRVTYQDPTNGLPYGSGCLGAAGFSLDLIVFGDFNPGGQATASMIHGNGGSPAFLVFGNAPANLPLPWGCPLLVAPPLLIAGPYVLPGSGPGVGTLSITATIPATATPGIITVQGFVLDPGAFAGVASSEGVLFPIL